MNAGIAKWLARVDAEMLRRFHIDHRDAGWSRAQIDAYFGFAMSPKDFVQWFGLKYDLSEVCTFAPHLR